MLRGTMKRSKKAVIIRHSNNSVEYDVGLPAAAAEIKLLKAASVANFGPNLYAYGYCKNKKYFWQALEFFDSNLLNYMENWTSLQVNYNNIEKQLSVLFMRMANQRIFCVDLKPENVVVNFDQNTGAITNMKLIDFDNIYCMERGEENPRVLLISMLCIFANNASNKPHKFFQDVLRHVFLQGDQQSGDLLTEVVSFLATKSIGDILVSDVMRAYYNLREDVAGAVKKPNEHDVMDNILFNLVGGGAGACHARGRGQARVPQVHESANMPSIAAARAAESVLSKRRQQRKSSDTWSTEPPKGASKGTSKGASKGTSKGASKGTSKGASKGTSKGASKGTSKGASKSESKSKTLLFARRRSQRLENMRKVKAVVR